MRAAIGVAVSATACIVGWSGPAVAEGPLWPAPAADEIADDAVFGAAFVPLQARADALLRALQPDDEVAVQTHLHRAVRAWTERRPVAAAVSFGLLLDRSIASAERARYLTEAARVEVRAGFHDTALAHALASVDGDTPRYVHIAAFESLVQVAAAALTGPSESSPPPPASTPLRALPLPSVLRALDRYLQAVKHDGAVDAAAYETVYELGRILLLLRDPGAAGVLQIVPADVPAGRRALYVLGVHHLIAKETEGAVALFRQAAGLAPSPLLASLGAEEQARDDAVREMAWMALARISYDGGDLENAEHAYQQVSPGSPHHLTALYELGWLLMDARKPRAARDVFAAVLAAQEGTARADEAKLLWGTVLLEDEGYRAAERYFEELTQQFASRLGRYETAAGNIGAAVDLVDDCRAREAALADPQLAEMLRSPEAQTAVELSERMRAVETVQLQLEAQIDAVERVWHGNEEDNPFVLLASDRALVADVLNEVRALSSRIQQAEARQGWSASASEPIVAPGHCCSDIRQRVKGLRRTVEGLLARVDATELSMRAEVSTMHAELTALKEAHAQRMPQLAREVRAAQAEAMQDALTAERTRLRRLLLEGESGALQAAWLYKEDHREEIRKQEIERKQKMDELDRSLADLLEDDD